VFFIEDMYSKICNNEMQLKNMSMVLGIIAMFLSCLGLWGITGIIYEARTKEIGIRKINGAKITQIIAWLLKDIIMIVAIALFFAIPVAYYLMDQWLNNFAYRTSLNWWIFILAGITTFTIAIITVSLQSWKTAARNPVDALRYE
jgi:putative ABC transport system permease protein